MIAPIVLGFLLGAFKFNFAENVLKVFLTEFNANAIEWVPYTLLKIALFFCLWDISTLSDLSRGLDGALKFDSSIALRNISVGVVCYACGFFINALFSMRAFANFNLKPLSVALPTMGAKKCDRKTKHFVTLSSFLFGNLVSEPRLINGIIRHVENIYVKNIHALVSKVNRYEASLDSVRISTIKRQLGEDERQDLFRNLSSIAHYLGCTGLSEITYLRLIGTRLGIERATQIEILRAAGLYSRYDSNHSQQKSYEHAGWNRHEPVNNPPYNGGALAILGLHRTATRQDISAAYRSLAKKYHPDQFASVDLSPDERMAIEAKMKNINVAYSELMK